MILMWHAVADLCYQRRGDCFRWETQLSVAKKLMQRAPWHRNNPNTLHILYPRVKKVPPSQRWRVPEGKNTKHEKIFRQASAFLCRRGIAKSSMNSNRPGWIGASARCEGASQYTNIFSIGHINVKTNNFLFVTFREAPAPAPEQTKVGSQDQTWQEPERRA